ncbi:MAG: RagB/SusD family nutrient uptake outer membrane protein [Chitinophagaceae bacterium]
MNKRFYILFLTIAVATGSCSKLLDQKPVSSLVEESYYANTNEVETGVIACYDGLQQVYDIEYKLTEVRCDNNGNNIYPIEGDWGAIKRFTDAPSTFFTLDFWQKSYNTIARCNLVLKHLDNVTDADKKRYFEGEAKFIRALMYFNLVRLYGDVPLITSNINYTEKDKFKRIASTEVYKLIVSDLSTALDMCPASWSSTDGLARASKGAARALLGKVYLTQKDWPNAKIMLEPLATGTTYNLLDAYGDIFSLNKEMSQEIIFAVRYKANSNKEGNTFSYIYTATGDARYIRGSTDYLALFVTADSIRKKTTFSTTSNLCGKFLDPTAASYDAGNDFPILRFADVLLMYAEVLNELNGTPADATLAPLNRVRKRAGAGLEQYTTTTLTTQQAIRNAIDKERRLEFGYENQRWYDLLRKEPATAISIMNTFLTGAGYLNVNIPAYRLTYPIPQSEIDLSSGVMEQTAGYK